VTDPFYIHLFFSFFFLHFVVSLYTLSPSQNGLRPDLMLPFVSSIVETVQLPLQSAASSLQSLCRDVNTQAKSDGEPHASLLDLFFLAYMILLAALRSDARSQYTSTSVLLLFSLLLLSSRKRTLHDTHHRRSDA